METGAVSAAVLAGGYSRRMGRDKAELLLGEYSLIERQIQKLKSIGIGDIMLSGYGRPIEDCRNIPDIFPHRGPLSGVHACLKAAENRACLVISVDMPLIPENTLRALVKTHRNGITALEHSGRVEPLAAVYDRALSCEAERILASEKTAIMQLLSVPELTRLVYSGDEFLLTNCNTPEEYKKIQTYWSQG